MNGIVSDTHKLECATISHSNTHMDDNAATLEKSAKTQRYTEFFSSVQKNLL